MILICANELAGPTGFHKSVVETANALHRAGYPVAVLSFLGTGDGASTAIPRWPLDPGVPSFVLQTLAAEGGRLLHRNLHPVFAGQIGALSYSFTENQLAVLRQLDAQLTDDDTVIFTSAIQALAFQQALGDRRMRARTLLQIHGDYLHHVELWDLLQRTQGVIDRLQTVASGLRAQFIPLFDEDDVVFIPNIHSPIPLVREPHEGVNVVLPASYQHRKNQLDAVRALALVEDESVRLSLWGNINPLNPYFASVRDLVTELGLTDRVRFEGLGTESDVYRAADVVLMTSLSEGFGYPLLEAAHHGLPAVTYDFEFGPRDAVVDGETGFVVPVGDVHALAAVLARLGGDKDLRDRVGARAREFFDQQFSVAAVVRRYGELVGPPGGRGVDLRALFSPAGTEPVAVGEIAHEVRRVGTGRRHRFSVTSPAKLFDVRVDDGEHVETATVRSSANGTQIEFAASGIQVVSYATAAGSEDRHYLVNTTRDHGFQVLPYLRRDSGYGDGCPPVADTIFASSGGARRLSVASMGPAVLETAGLVRAEVARRARQVLASRSAPAHAGANPPAVTSPESSGPAPSGPAATPIEPAAARPARTSSLRAGVARAAGVPTAVGSLGRAAASFGVSAARSLTMTIVAKPTVLAHREVPRHPRYPVTAGVDSFGAPINAADAVTVANSGSPARPTVSVAGEYDWVLLRDGASERRISAPFSYGELFERVCDAERKHALFDITTRDGVHLWELGRSALMIQLAESLGMWGSEAGAATPVRDVYTGPKRLTTAPTARRVVFDYSRRGQSDYRTAAFRADDTLFITPPEPDGYPEVDDTNLVYPMHEFNAWRQDWRRRLAHLRVPEVDARPFEKALSEALGIQVDVGDHLRNRLAKFLAEREFFTPVFERIAPDEVLLAESHWWPGITAAAQSVGAMTSDIQDAETGRYHGTFWFGGTPHHGARRFYAWSEYWAERTNVYAEHVVVPRPLSPGGAAPSPDAADVRWDVCVIGQPRVLRRILAFTRSLVEERPGLRVVIAPHPAQRHLLPRALAEAGLADKVTISPLDTLTTVERSDVAVGGYSTSLWETVALGTPTYVIPVPGHELTLDDIASGLFRMANSPHDLVPYEVPQVRATIFGTV